MYEMMFKIIPFTYKYRNKKEAEIDSLFSYIILSSQTPILTSSRQS